MTTNNTIYIDSPMSDDVRRHAVYQGQIFVYLRSLALTRFVEFPRGLIEEAFAPFDPCLAQHGLSSRVLRSGHP